jgi:Helix-turn-helix domain
MRIRKDRAHEPDRRHDRRLPPRAATGVAGAPAGGDAQLGRIFHSMRVSMKASRETIARRLAIAVATIDTFEAGAVAAFPHWRETERIVRTYCELLRLDAEPILWRIRGQLRALAAPPRPSAPAASSHPLPLVVRASGSAGRSADWPAPGPRPTRLLLALAASAALVAIGACVTFVPGAAYRAMSVLPRALRGPARAGLDQLMLFTATRYDGLRWVDVGDPRVRKADKLQGAR